MNESLATTQSLQTLLNLAKLARKSEGAREAGFLLVNETRSLTSYRQSALWLKSGGLYALSGVVQLEANVPYTQWVSAVFEHWQNSGLKKPSTIDTRVDDDCSCQDYTALDLPSHLQEAWSDWWPAHACWIPFDTGAVVFVRDDAWQESDQVFLMEWVESWSHEFARHHQPQLNSILDRLRLWREQFFQKSEKPLWRQPVPIALALTISLLLFPVKLTVLASAELTPFNPVVIRSPLDGVIDTFHVQPNQLVKKDQLLFGFDEALTQSRLDVALQAFATAKAEYRQTVHLAMSDARAKNQLSMLNGKIEEKSAEVEFLSGQLDRARVLAPQDGVVLMDEPSEWIGRPISVGERILRIATPGDAEVEAWLALSDAIRLEAGSEVTLYLNASPLSAVQAKIRYVAHDAVQRPDGQYAYRVRAQLTEKTDYRVGSKGTAKLHGDWVPLSYWVFRRPLASIRAYLGL